MSTAFNLGVKLGSLVRGVFVPQKTKRIEPSFLPENKVSEIEQLRIDHSVDLSNQRIHVESEIKTVIKYQEVFLDRLIAAYLINHPEDTIDEMPQDIVQIFQAMSRNARYLDEMATKMENIDLKKHEVVGFPEVTTLINKIKKVKQ